MYITDWSRPFRFVFSGPWHGWNLLFLLGEPGQGIHEVGRKESEEENITREEYREEGRAKWEGGREGRHVVLLTLLCELIWRPLSNSVAIYDVFFLWISTKSFLGGPHRWNRCANKHGWLILTTCPITTRILGLNHYAMLMPMRSLQK